MDHLRNNLCLYNIDCLIQAWSVTLHLFEFWGIFCLVVFFCCCFFCPSIQLRTFVHISILLLLSLLRDSFFPLLFGIGSLPIIISSSFTCSGHRLTLESYLELDLVTELSCEFSPCFSWYVWIFQVGPHTIVNQGSLYFPLSVSIIIIGFSCPVAHSRNS